jgi:hypothetical protein
LGSASVTLGALCGCANEGALGQSMIGQKSPGCGAGDNCPSLAFDAPIAVGASLPLDIDLSLKGGGAPPLTLVSGNESVFRAEGLTLTGVGPGVASVLITSEEDVVLDFTAIWVQQPTGLALQRRAADGTALGDVPAKLGLSKGDSVLVSVSAVSSSKQALAGTAPADWKADTDAVSIETDVPDGQARLVAHAAGKATITVSALGLQRAFEVEVAP